MKAQRLEEKNQQKTKNNNVPGKKISVTSALYFVGRSAWKSLVRDLKKKKKITSVNYVKLCQEQKKEKTTRLYASPRRLQLVIIRVWFSDIFTAWDDVHHVDMQICAAEIKVFAYITRSRLSTTSFEFRSGKKKKKRLAFPFNLSCRDIFFDSQQITRVHAYYVIPFRDGIKSVVIAFFGWRALNVSASQSKAFWQQ